MRTVVEDIDENCAASIFRDDVGSERKATHSKHLLKYGELYKKQLLRSDPIIFCNLEQENKLI